MITVLIPTYNRPTYLRRILSYYSDYDIAHNIIIADSSSNENKEINKKIISSLAGINTSYMDEYPSEINPYNKIIGALNNVTTKYCVLCADDDFITPNGIDKSIGFLEENPDFTIAHGYYVSFYLENTERKQQFCWRPLYSRESNTFSDPKTRLSHHLSNYSQPTLYAVHRTNLMKMIFQETSKFTDDDRFGELLPSMLVLIYGKAKYLDLLYGARESLPGSTGRTDKNMEDFIKDGTYNEKYAKFKNCLSIHLSKEGQLDIEESGKVIDDAMSIYLRQFSRNNKKTIMRRMSDFLDYLGLPEWMDGSIRALYRKLFLPSPFSMEIPPSSEYYDDFNKIRLHVLSHSKR